MLPRRHFEEGWPDHKRSVAIARQAAISPAPLYAFPNHRITGSDRRGGSYKNRGHPGFCQQVDAGRGKVFSNRPDGRRRHDRIADPVRRTDENFMDRFRSELFHLHRYGRRRQYASMAGILLLNNSRHAQLEVILNGYIGKKPVL